MAGSSSSIGTVVDTMLASRGFDTLLPFSFLARLTPGSVGQVDVFHEIPIGVFFAALGAIFVVAGVYGLRNALSFRRRANETEGVVTELRTSSIGRGSDSGFVYYPVLQFTTHDGREVQTKARTGSSPAPAREGETVTVRYDPDDPASADVGAGWTGLFVYGLFVALGSVFVVVGIGMWYLSRIL